jgi:hypothetical protein
MQEYADPVIDWLDAGQGILRRRLFREVRITLRGLIALVERTPLPDLSHAVMHPAAKRVIHQESQSR